MIPVWNEEAEWRENGYPLEQCVFCNKPTTTWHENTNNPVCVDCAKTHTVQEIPEDHGQLIRKQKRNGTFKRPDSVTRAN